MLPLVSNAFLKNGNDIFSSLQIISLHNMYNGSKIKTNRMLNDRITIFGLKHKEHVVFSTQKLLLK